MAFVDERGRVRLRAVPSPAPEYDFAPYMTNDPTDDAVRSQATDLLVRAVRMDVANGSSLESDGVRSEWRRDWGQRIASGAEREDVAGIVAGMDPDDVRAMLVAALYSATRWAMDQAGEAFVDVMGMNLARMATAERTGGQLTITLSNWDGETEGDGADE